MILNTSKVCLVFIHFIRFHEPCAAGRGHYRSDVGETLAVVSRHHVWYRGVSADISRSCNPQREEESRKELRS